MAAIFYQPQCVIFIDLKEKSYHKVISASKQSWSFLITICHPVHPMNSRISCQKGPPYLPCVSMEGRALLAGYPRIMLMPWPIFYLLPGVSSCCAWPITGQFSLVWAYSEQEIENGPWCLVVVLVPVNFIYGIQDNFTGTWAIISQVPMKQPWRVWVNLSNKINNKNGQTKA